MLYYLTSKDGNLVTGSIFYLLPNRSYTVGRRECDLVVKDVAVSRKHAVITVNVNEVSVTDCGSTYGTFVSDTKLKINQPMQVSDNTVIKFGIMTAVFNLNQIPIVTTTSGIRSELKVKLRNSINAIGGLLTQNWTEQCTHLTVEEILLTVKVLSAVIVGIPIVTVQYWDDYVDAIKNNKPIPNTSYYIPKCSEVLLNGNLSFEYKEERKTLFKDKIFIFALKSDKAKMGSLIKLAGGEANSWEENPFTEEDIQEEILKKYIIIQTSDSGDVAKIDKALITFINKYTETGKRTIQLQEIALAIVGCSCEKECNPSFNRQAAVFKSSSSQSQHNTNGKVLAMATQSLGFDCMAEPKTELIIPETCDLTSKIEIHDESVVKMEEENPSKPLDVIGTQCSSKRDSETDHSGNSAKKPKMEETALSASFNNSVASTLAKSIEPRSEPQSEKGSGKSLFAFKYDKIANAPTNYINPFAKKRKAQEDILNQSKKPTFLNTTLSLSSTNNSNVVVNPFSNILKSRRRNTPEDVKFTSTQLHADIMGANSLEIHFSAITAVDPVLERSFRWIRKSDNSITSLLNSHENEEAIDKELSMFINSFKNAVIVEEDKDLIVRRPGLWNVTNQSLNDSNIKNFKRFKKVQPLRTQTTIVPDSSYVSIVCNQHSE